MPDSRRIAIAALIAALACPLAAQQTEPAATTDAVASAILSGQLDLARRSLARLDPPENDPSLTKIAGWVQRFDGLAAEREQLHTAEYTMELNLARHHLGEQRHAEALAAVRRAIDIRRLSRLPSMPSTTPPAREAPPLLSEDWVEDLIEQAMDQALAHEREGKWLDAARIYVQLAGLHEHDRPTRKAFERTTRQLGKRARLETIYTRENQEQFTQRVEGVHRRLVEAVLSRINRHYVRIEVDYTEMAERALENLRILAESEKLREVFTGLLDQQRRNEFIQAIRLQENDLANLRKRGEQNNYIWRDLAVAFESITRLNARTINLPESVLTFEFIEAAMQDLDEFSSVIWPSDIRDFQRSVDAQFVGIGVQISLETGELTVVTPLEDTPAYRAGLHAGDVIRRVFDERTGITHDMSNLKDTGDAVKIITGPRGSTIVLTVFRPEINGEIEFTLKRDVIQVETVKGIERADDNSWSFWLDEPERIAYVRVTQFAPKTVADLTAVLTKLDTRQMRGLILDLRGNGGGHLQAAEQMADLFLSSGPIVSTRGRTGRQEYRYDAREGQIAEQVALVVLIDAGSASASEIVSGAIKDTQRGLIVGTRSFGKGSVQNLLRMGPGPEDPQLKLTTSKYYLPSDRSIHREEDAELWGVDPDLELPLSPTELRQISELRRDRDLLRRHDDGSAVIAPPSTRPAATQPATATATQPASTQPAGYESLPRLSADPQLELALTTLRTKLITNAQWRFSAIPRASPSDN